MLCSNNEYIKELDTPVVLVLYDPAVENAFQGSDLPEELASSTDFVFLFIDGSIETMGENDNIGIALNRRYQRTLSLVVASPAKKVERRVFSLGAAIS